MTAFERMLLQIIRANKTSKSDIDIREGAA